jgi:hypothetical protein
MARMLRLPADATILAAAAESHGQRAAAKITGLGQLGVEPPADRFQVSKSRGHGASCLQGDVFSDLAQEG